MTSMNPPNDLDGGAVDNWLTAAIQKDIEAENSTAIGCPAPDGTYDTVVSAAFGPKDREQPTPTKQTIASELANFQSDYEVDSDGSENEFYEALPNEGMPNRKPKRHAPMNAEQQQTEMERLQTLIAQYHDQETKICTTAQVLTPTSDTQATMMVPKADSPDPINDSACPSPPKNSLKRRRMSQEKTPWNKKAIIIRSDTQKILNILIGLGTPFDDRLGRIVDYVRNESMSRNRKYDSIPLEELLKIEAEWKSEHAAKLQQTIAFLERYGLIPFGGVDAAETGRDTLE